MNNYQQARIEALEMEIKRLNQTINYLIQEREKKPMKYVITVDDPVFNQKLKDIEVNYEHETGE